MDQALTPVGDQELTAMEMYSVSDGARAAVQLHRDKQRRRARDHDRDGVEASALGAAEQ
jgi:hypothetical protein